jgi:hypothetical protein
MRAILIQRNGHALPKYLTEWKPQKHRFKQENRTIVFYDYGRAPKIQIVDVSDKPKQLKKRYINPN